MYVHLWATQILFYIYVIKSMFMDFCVRFSWPWGWLQMWPKHVM